MPGNLPNRPTRFVGHAVEVARIAATLDATPVVTITGPGGVGKTRTAIELARRAREYFPDGVWFVNLALLDDGADVVPFVCETLRDVAPLARDAASFSAALGTRKVLLLLDCCEHVLAQSAELVQTIVSGAPNARVLATSRMPLGVDGEAAHRLESLAVEDAVELFYDRARLSGIAVGEEKKPLVRAIVSRLDAIPLAIELAVPQLRSIGPEELLHNLDDRLDLEGMENRGAPSRQQTLDAMHDWSHRLLSPSAQKLFRRLAIFGGGCTLEAAMHVCSDEDFNEARVSEALAELIDQSLVLRETIEDHGPRYRMLEITRAYAQTRLFESREYDDVAEAHVRFFRMLAKRFESVLESMPVIAWQRAVRIEAQNFRAALSLALDAGDVESPAAICEALHYWLWEHGSVHAGDLTRRIATILATTMDPASEAALRLGHSALLRRTDRRAALEDGKRSHECYRALGDLCHVADALRVIGSLQHDVLGAPAAKLAGEMEEVSRAMLDSGETLRAAELLNNLGVSYAQMLEDMRLHDALTCFERAAGLLEARGDRERAGRVIGNSAATAYLLGEVELAVKWAGRAVGFFDSHIDNVGAGHQWSNYGFYLVQVGRYDDAHRALQRGLEIARNLGDRVGLSSVLEYAAHYYHHAGSDRFAARMIGAAEALLPPDIAAQARAAVVMQQLIIELRENLGPDVYEEEYRIGLGEPPEAIMRDARIV